MASLRTDALIQQRSIVENPAADGGVIDREAGLRHDLFEIAVAQG